MEAEFSVNISKLRKERGLNQRKAASELKISQALLSHYENGIREPGLDFVIRICDYYGVSADFLLGRTKIRETILSNCSLENDAQVSSADKLKQEAIVLAAALFRTLSQCEDEVALPALSYIASSEYRLLCNLFPDSEEALLSPDRKKAEILGEIDMKLQCLKVSEGITKYESKPCPEMLRRNISKVTYKSFESVISRTEERIGALGAKIK